MTDLKSLCPTGEEVWETYYGKDGLLFFLTGPAGQSSTLNAQKGEFTLYSVNTGARGTQKASKLGSGGNPIELEAKYKVPEAMAADAAK